MRVVVTRATEGVTQPISLDVRNETSMSEGIHRISEEVPNQPPRTPDTGHVAKLNREDINSIPLLCQSE
jgi:hypothetical protein